MTTRMLTRPQTQELIKNLRGHGYKVDKINGIYKVIDDFVSGDTLFAAMPGTRGYLVKYKDEIAHALATPGDLSGPVGSKVW